jgi:hypothetical protein
MCIFPCQTPRRARDATEARELRAAAQKTRMQQQQPPDDEAAFAAAAAGVAAEMAALRQCIPAPGVASDDERVRSCCVRAENATRALRGAIAGAAAAAAAAGAPPTRPLFLSSNGDDYVGAFSRLVRGARRVVVAAPPPGGASAECLTRGGFGRISATSLTITPPPPAPPVVRSDVVVKAIRSVANAARGGGGGADSLIEAAVRTAFADAGSRLLMPALAIDIAPRTSETRVVLPRGICDVSTIVKHRKVPLPRAVMLAWAADIAEAVAEMHARGVAHGDVKSGNVIVFPRPARAETAAAVAAAVTAALAVIGAVRHVQTPLQTPAVAAARGAAEDAVIALLPHTAIRVTDFGLSSVCTAEARGTVACDAIPGYTSLYRPPEVWRGNQWSFPADVWALGCTIFDLAFGRTLFQEQRGAPAGAEERRAMLAAMDAFVSNHDLFAVGAAAAAAETGARGGGGAGAAAAAAAAAAVPPQPSPTTTGGAGAAAGGGGATSTPTGAASPILPPPPSFTPCSVRSWTDWSAVPRRVIIALAGTLRLSPHLRVTAADAATVLRGGEPAFTPPPPPRHFAFPATDVAAAIRQVERAIVATQSPAKSQEEVLFALTTAGGSEHAAAAKFAAAVRDASSDACVCALAEWLLARHLLVVHTLRSPRIRAMPLSATAALCCATAAKVLRRSDSVRESVAALATSRDALHRGGGGSPASHQSSSGDGGALPAAAAASPRHHQLLPPCTRDERALCAGLRHRLIPLA